MKKFIAVLCVSVSMIALPSAGVLAAEISATERVAPITKSQALTVSLDTQFGDQASETCQGILAEEGLISETAVVIPKSLDGAACHLAFVKWTRIDSRGERVYHTRYYDLENAMSAAGQTKDL